MSDYRVCTCTDCGMAYADGIPAQEVFDHYYQVRSKYENPERLGEGSPYDLERFQNVAERLGRILAERTLKVLEVGAATGDMLAALRKGGFENLLGLDPSPNCAAIAASHGVTVKNATLQDLAENGETFDLVIMLAVLEHVRDLSGFIESVKRILAPRGAVYLQVPDAAAFHAWPDAPFQQFSIEHINFFARTSLQNLMLRYGFTEEVCEQYSVSSGPGYVMPVVDALFRMSDTAPTLRNMERDEATGPALREYIKCSERVDDHLDGILRQLAASKREIIVWGVGTHTQRLLATGRMEAVPIVAYTDSNVHLQGSRLDGKPILPPSELKGRREPILISSRAFQEVIREQIRGTLQLDNEIITLYKI